MSASQQLELTIKVGTRLKVFHTELGRAAQMPQKRVYTTGEQFQNENHWGVGTASIELQGEGYILPSFMILVFSPCNKLESFVSPTARYS